MLTAQLAFKLFQSLVVAPFYSDPSLHACVCVCIFWFIIHNKLWFVWINLFRCANILFVANKSNKSFNCVEHKANVFFVAHFVRGRRSNNLYVLFRLMSSNAKNTNNAHHSLIEAVHSLEQRIACTFTVCNCTRNEDPLRLRSVHLLPKFDYFPIW